MEELSIEIIITLAVIILVAVGIYMKARNDKQKIETIPSSFNMPLGELWLGDIAHKAYTENYEQYHFNQEVIAQLDKTNWAMMCAAMYDVKAKHTYVDNPTQGDWHGINGFDCKAFALSFRKNAGLPSGSVRLATCKTSNFYHAVALVFTDCGVYALDNRYDNPMPWDSLNYTEWAVEAIDGQWRLIK